VEKCKHCEGFLFHRIDCPVRTLEPRVFDDYLMRIDPPKADFLSGMSPQWLRGADYRIFGFDLAVPGADKTAYTARNPGGEIEQLSRREFERLMYAHYSPVSPPGMKQEPDTWGRRNRSMVEAFHRPVPKPISQGTVYTVEVSYTLPSGILVTKRWRERA
jgi:hypothetical protein